MRLLSRLVPVAMLLWLGASPLQAQVDIPLVEFGGSLKASVRDCSDGTTSKFKAKGPLQIVSQQGATFTAVAELPTIFQGVECTARFDITATVNNIGTISGSYTHLIDCPDGSVSSSGGGEVSGRFKPGRLAIALVSTDAIDFNGAACSLKAAFVGKGPPGNAVCSALTIKAAARLGGKLYNCFARAMKQAHLGPPTVDKLNACIEKAQMSFVKARLKAAAKSDKAGGECLEQLGLGAGITNVIDVSVTPLIDTLTIDSALDRRANELVAAAQGRFFKKLMIIESSFMLKLEPEKYLKAREKARDAFLKKVIGKLTIGVALGLVWDGPLPAVLANDVELRVQQVMSQFD